MEEAPRWPIYRPELDADVTQQSGTVCAAALLCFMERAAAYCIEPAHICQDRECLVSTVTDYQMKTALLMIYLSNKNTQRL